MTSIFHWTPNTKINEWQLGEALTNAIEFMNTHEIVGLPDYEEGALHFLYEHHVWFSINAMGVLESIETWTNLYLDDINLIGLSRQELINLLIEEKFLYDDNNDCYTFDSLGAIFWLENDIVTAASVARVSPTE